MTTKKSEKPEKSYFVVGSIHDVEMALRGKTRKFKAEIVKQPVSKGRGAERYEVRDVQSNEIWKPYHSQIKP